MRMSDSALSPDPFAKPATAQPSAPPPPPPPYPPLTSAPVRRGSVPAAAVVFGFLVAATGLFALPQSSYGGGAGSDYGFVEIRSFAALLDGRDNPGQLNVSSYALGWWQYGILIAAGVLGLMVVAAVAAPTRPIGWLLAAVSAATIAAHAIGLHKMPDYRELSMTFRFHDDMYANAGPGVWTAFAGLGVLLLAGVALGLTRPR